MKNLISILSLIFLISCKKESEKVQVDNQKDYVFDYTKEKIVGEENSELYLNQQNYEIEKYIEVISKEEYIKDSLNYKNEINLKNYKFINNTLETSYGKVKFIPYEDENSDLFVNYSYLGFAESIESHIINLDLYEGERTLLLSNQNYQYTIIPDNPIFSQSRKYALNFKDNEGISSQISVYKIENLKLKHFITIWSENYISDQVSWDEKDNIIVKLRKIETGVYSYAKIPVANLQSNNKIISNTNSLKSQQDWRGNYEITTKAISEYNNKEIDLSYSITVISDKSSTLSIGAEQSQDYWCEGEYQLNEEQRILHAKGKCDEDDINDFYLKQENGKYFIKSKRFLNQDWQELYMK